MLEGTLWYNIPVIRGSSIIVESTRASAAVPLHWHHTTRASKQLVRQEHFYADLELQRYLYAVAAPVLYLAALPAPGHCERTASAPNALE